MHSRGAATSSSDLGPHKAQNTVNSVYTSRDHTTLKQRPHMTLHTQHSTHNTPNIPRLHAPIHKLQDTRPQQVRYGDDSLHIVQDALDNRNILMGTKVRCFRGGWTVWARARACASVKRSLNNPCRPLNIHLSVMSNTYTVLKQDDPWTILKPSLNHPCQSTKDPWTILKPSLNHPCQPSKDPPKILKRSSKDPGTILKQSLTHPCQSLNSH